MIEKIFFIVNNLGTICLIASLVCSLTPTPRDDALLAKVYKLVELAALNIGKAKQTGQ